MESKCACGSGTCARTPEQAEKFKALRSYIDSLPIDEHPERRRGFLIQILHRAQNLFGFLPEEVQRFVAKNLKISPAEVYGVISFYSYFVDQPIGRYKISVCTGTACFVKGASKVLDEFKRQLKVSEGETTADGKFFLGALRCLGACSLAPVVMVNDRVFGKMSPEKVSDILKSCE